MIRNRKLFPSNTYLYTNDTDNECIIIDPGFDYELIKMMVEERPLKPIAVISTHGHFDHVGGAAYLKKHFNIPFYLHEADLKICKSANFYLKIAKVHQQIETPIPDYLFKGEYEKLLLGGFELEVFNLPGHSPGSCVIKIKDNLFSGDILYKNGLGSGSIPREDEKMLKHSIKKIFNIFNGEHRIFPGHGPSDFLDAIKNNNIELKKYLSEDGIIND